MQLDNIKKSKEISIDSNFYNFYESNCKLDSIVNKIQEFLEVSDLYDVCNHHAKNCTFIISCYKINRKEITRIEEKFKNSNFLKFIDSISHIDSEKEIENYYVNLNNQKLKNKIFEYENLLTKIKQISTQNIILIIKLTKELSYIKETKKLICQALSLSEKIKKSNSITSYIQDEIFLSPFSTSLTEEKITSNCSSNYEKLHDFEIFDEIFLKTESIQDINSYLCTNKSHQKSPKNTKFGLNNDEVSDTTRNKTQIINNYIKNIYINFNDLKYGTKKELNQNTKMDVPQKIIEKHISTKFCHTEYDISLTPFLTSDFDFENKTKTTYEINTSSKIINMDNDTRIFDKIKQLFKIGNPCFSKDKTSSQNSAFNKNLKNNNLKDNLTAAIKIGVKFYPIIKMSNFNICEMIKK